MSDFDELPICLQYVHLMSSAASPATRNAVGEIGYQMIPDIAYEYSRERFRQMMLDGADYQRAQEWRTLFLRKYESNQADARRSAGRASKRLNEMMLALESASEHGAP